jgi:uncharacterized protein (TIGR02217 family)
MSFIDEYMPEKVPGYPCISAPRFKTTIQISAGGNERRNQEWEHPLHQFILPEAIARDADVINSLKTHWLIMAGPYNSFPWSDPIDKASIDHVPNLPDATLETLIDMEDQFIGTADGFTDTFQLVKTYSIGGNTYDRTIHLPVVDTVVVAIDGVLVPDTDYTVTRPGGEVVFDVPPPDPTPDPGIITAGFLFDVEVRFESDDAFEGIVRSYQVGAFADITLIEVRPC